MINQRAPLENGTVILKRTFNQQTWDKDLRPIGMLRFWRVVSQWHKNANSDLSIRGLKDAGIIK
jgi:hypothetical protein